MMNPETGKANNVAFSFKRFSNKYITGVQLQIATDSGFTALVYDQSFTGIDDDTISQVIGPTGTTTTESRPKITYIYDAAGNPYQTQVT
jgi:hypothetical protein